MPQLVRKHINWIFNSSVAPKRTCNCSLLFCSQLLFWYTCTSTTTICYCSNFPSLLSAKFKRNQGQQKKISNGELWKLEVWQFSSDASNAVLRLSGWSFCALIIPSHSLNNFSSSTSPTLLFFTYFAVNLNIWKRVVSLLSLKRTVVFWKTRFSSHDSVCLLIYLYL